MPLAQFQDVPWTPILYFFGLLGMGVTGLVWVGKHTTKTDIRLTTVESKVDKVEGKVDGIVVTLARMEGAQQGYAQAKSETVLPKT